MDLLKNSVPAMDGGVTAALQEAFDFEFYRSSYDDAPAGPEDALAHFAALGWREGRDPNAWFSTQWYLKQNPDVVASGVNPLVHYLLTGFYEGRETRPSPNASSRAARCAEAKDHQVNGSPDSAAFTTSDAESHGVSEQLSPNVMPELTDDQIHAISVISTAIEAAYYQQQALAVGIEAPSDPAKHYVLVGAAHGLDPTDWFSTKYYSTEYPDVGDAGINPFYHYLVAGKSEGRLPIQPSDDSLYERETIKGEFDAEFYLGAYSDVESAGADPLLHFVTQGWREGRDPNPFFSTKDYLEAYGDIADAGINPFYHYIVAGRKEGRRPKLDLGYRYAIIAALRDFDSDIERQKAYAPAIEVKNGDMLRRVLRSGSRCANTRVHISVSHDNYTENYGGVQLCLRREAEAFATKHFDHVHIFPVRPLLAVESGAGNDVIGVVVNGVNAGYYHTRVVADALRTVFKSSQTRMAAVHSLLGHDVEGICSLLCALQVREAFYWVHDYSSLCTNFNLLRNDVKYCGSPSMLSTACSICKYGDSRLRQVTAHQKFFTNFETRVLAPSATALALWKKQWSGYAAEERVLEHCSLKPSGRSVVHAPAAYLGVKQPLRIAYLGIPSTHKGWPVFKDLALRFGKDPRYEFYHLGTHRQRGVPVTFQEVIVTETKSNSMQSAILSNQIHISFIWSVWPETFCFTAYETISAGAAILTCRDSGNVAKIAESKGLILEDETGLIDLFDSGRIVDVFRHLPHQTYELCYSEMTAEFAL